MIIPISPVLVADTNKKSFSVPLLVSEEGRNTDRRFETNALIDSGAGGTFINKKFAQQNGIALIPIEKLIQAFNMDWTKNNTGTIEHCTWLKIQIRKKKISTRFLATGLGEEKMILGLPWLKQYNPKINWNTGTIDINSIQVKTTFWQNAFEKHRTNKNGGHYTTIQTYHGRGIQRHRPFTSKQTSSGQWIHSTKPSYNRRGAQDRFDEDIPQWWRWSLDKSKDFNIPRTSALLWNGTSFLYNQNLKRE